MSFSAIAHVETSGSSSTACTTGAINSTGADLLVGIVHDFGPNAVGAFSDSKGNTWHPLTTKQQGTVSRATIFWSNPSSIGSGHTFSYAGGASSFPSITVSAWASGGSPVFDVENGNSTASSSTLTPGSVTPNFANSLVITGFTVSAGTPSSIDGGFTITGSLATGAQEGASHAYLIQTSIAAANPTWTNGSSTDLTAVIAVFKLPPTFSSTLSATQGQTATLGTSRSLLKTLSATQGQTATLGKSKTFTKTLTATQGQTATLAGVQQTVLDVVVPSSDRTTGGDTITLLGSSIQNGATVKVGGTAATSVVWVNAGRITFVAPAHTVGVVSIVVTNPDLTTATLTNCFTYYTPNADLTALVSSISGSDPSILKDSLSITKDVSHGQANFQIPTGGTRPVPFSPVKFGLGSLADRDLIFRGKQQNTVQHRKETSTNKWWDGMVVDSSAEFNRYLFWGSYSSVAADVIALDLLTKFAPDFTGAGIASGLPAIDLILEGVTGDQAFQSIATAIGGYYYRDLSYDVRLFITESPTLVPDAITQTTATLLIDPPLKWWADTSMVRNRVTGIGVNTKILSALSPGAVLVPVENASIFDDATNTALVGSQRIAYTNRVLGGSGALVGSGGGPTAAPTVTPQLGSGLSSGTYKYAYTDVTGAGESLPSPLATAITASGIASPTLIGAPVNDSGGPYASGGITGTYSYRYTFYRDADGAETAATPPSSSVVCPATSRVNLPLAACETPPAGYSRRWYRTVAGGSTYKLLPASQSPGSWLEYGGNLIDIVQDSNLSATTAPGSNNTGAGQQVNVTAVALGASGTTSRKIYRTVVNGSQLKLLTTIANNTSTGPYLDTTPDGSLGANAPTSDTSGLSFATGGVVLAGATSILTTSPAPFRSAGGWIRGPGNQSIYYSGITDNTLTGVPASGVGSIMTSLLYGDQIAAAPMLVGVPATGVGAILTNVPATANVSLYCERNDTLSQAAIAAIEGGSSTGIYEFKIPDTSLVTQTALNARCDADLVQYASVDGIIKVTYDSFDRKNLPGKSVSVNRPDDGLIGDFIIQTVNISAIGRTANKDPIYSVTLSSIRYSFEDILRHMVVKA